MQSHPHKQPIIIIGCTILCLSILSAAQLVFPKNETLHKLDIWQVFKNDSLSSATQQASFAETNNQSNPAINTQNTNLYFDYSNNNIFEKKLKALSQIKNNNESFHILWLGDSFIETDILVNTVRKKLQQHFGGNGIGFMPISNNKSSNSQANINPKGNWTFENALQNISSGHYFIHGLQATTTTNCSLQLFAKTNKNSSLQFNLLGNNNITKPTLNFDGNNTIDTTLAIENNTTLFGATLMSEQGVFVHNLSMRGATGLHIQHVDSTVFETINKHLKPHIIIVEFGTNVIENNNINFSWYKTAFDKAINVLSKQYPEAAIVILSVADKASKTNGQYQTDAGIVQLINWQQEIAKKYNTVFFNTQTAMGGQNSMVSWATKTPLLAYKDYTHLNPAGEEKLGEIFYQNIFNH